MFLLDTNVLSDLRRGRPHPSPALRQWAERQPAQRLYLSAISALELEIGVQRMERKDPTQGAVLRTWLDAVLLAFEDRVLPFSGRTAQRCAPLHVPDPRAFRDSMIAATAAEHGFTVVTRNSGDFEPLGVNVLNPWKSSIGP